MTSFLVVIKLSNLRQRDAITLKPTHLEKGEYMEGIFQPPKRVLTGDQIATLVNGTMLSDLERQALELSCGWNKARCIIPDPDPETSRLLAWNKIRGNSCHQT